MLLTNIQIHSFADKSKNFEEVRRIVPDFDHQAGLIEI